MNKKIWLLAFIFIFFNQINLAQIYYYNGDSLHVWAEGGLFMRETADLKGKKITLIPYGSKILFESYYEHKTNVEIPFFKNNSSLKLGYKNCSDYKQKGIWIKVKYNNYQGFVFSGFISRFPVNCKYEEIYINEYVKNNFKLIGHEDKRGKYYDPEISLQYYEKGVTIHDFADKKGTSSYVFPEMSFEEGILLIKNNIEQNQKNGQICIIEYNDNNRKVKFTNNANWAISIQQVSGFVIITIEGWC